MNVKISAIIPVKANSSRAPGKNTLPFGDSNLLLNKIRQLKDSGRIDEIIVSSDSEEMLLMAKTEKVRAEKRPTDLADESRPFGDLVVHAANLMAAEHMMWAPVTSPTLDSAFYKNALEKYENALHEGYDSFTTVEDFKHFLMDKNGKPYNFNPSAAITNSQQLPEMYKWTCGCSIIPLELAIKHRFIFGDRPFCYEVSQYQAMDIDTRFDYELALAMFERQKSNGFGGQT